MKKISQCEKIPNILDDDIEILDGVSVSLHGSLNGDVHLADSATLSLHGIINGNVYTVKNSSLFIYGISNGDIHGDGRVILCGIMNTCGALPQNLCVKSRSIINGALQP